MKSHGDHDIQPTQKAEYAIDAGVTLPHTHIDLGPDPPAQSVSASKVRRTELDRVHRKEYEDRWNRRDMVEACNRSCQPLLQLPLKSTGMGRTLPASNTGREVSADRPQIDANECAAVPIPCEAIDPSAIPSRIGRQLLRTRFQVVERRVATRHSFDSRK